MQANARALHNRGNECPSNGIMKGLVGGTFPLRLLLWQRMKQNEVTRYVESSNKHSRIIRIVNDSFTETVIISG